MKTYMFVLGTIFLSGVIFAQSKPVMTCQPLDFKIVNVPKELKDLVDLNNQLNSSGMVVNLRCESKEAICFIVNNAMSCVKR